jgi:hypothetical protein
MTAPGVTPTSKGAGPSAINTGLCTLSFQDQVFRFRTNPNEIWWSYELLSNTEETFGGRVIQLLGTRLGELAVKIECGQGGWDYLMQVVLALRNLLSDQRNGNPATFEYTTRNWRLNVYSMSIPFQDQFDATVREIPLNFKIQEDVTGVLSQVTMDATFAMLQDGVYAPGYPLHNQYNDSTGLLGGLAAGLGTTTGGLLGATGDPIAAGGPTYLPAFLGDVKWPITLPTLKFRCR